MHLTDKLLPLNDSDLDFSAHLSSHALKCQSAGGPTRAAANNHYMSFL
jgi:hypothetical protein